MKRILVVIPSAVVAKTLVDSGALEELGRSYDLYFLSAADVVRRLPGSVTRIEPKTGASRVMRRLDFIFWYLELIYFLRIRGEDIRENFKFQQLTNRWKIIFRTLAAPGFIQLARLLDGIIFKLDQQIEFLMTRIRPELVIMPGSALDSYSFIVGRTARNLGLPTLFVITHWDYFSKKSLFRFIPDRIYVWGEDMLISATRCGSYARSRFSILGAPQFQKYLSGLSTRETAAQRLELDPSKIWLLYAAPCVPFDDLRVVDAVNCFIEQCYPGAVGLIFRPHPRSHPRKSRVKLRIEDLSHVVVDVRKQSECDQDQHYLDLLSLCSGLISPWSTMVLEFGLLGRPSLCLSFKDGIHDWDWSNAEQSDHAKALLSRKSVISCTTESQLFEKIQELIARSEDRTYAEKIIRSTEMAVYQDNCSYAARLLHQIQEDYFSSDQCLGN